MTDERNYLLEAFAILGGHTAILPERKHIEAMHEAHECELIKLAKELNDVSREILTR